MTVRKTLVNEARRRVQLTSELVTQLRIDLRLLDESNVQRTRDCRDLAELALRAEVNLQLIARALKEAAEDDLEDTQP